MPRLARFNLANIPQHIVQRGNNKQSCFFCDKDKNFYLKKLYEYSKKFNVYIHAYVLMTNHVHLLITPTTATGASLLMQFLGRSYVRYFNISYQRTGTLWEGRFKSALIDSENYFLLVSRYIELNPVRANMIFKPSDYQWSSFRANAFGEHNKLISPHECFLALGQSDKERQSNYLLLFKNKLPDKGVQKLRLSTNKSQILGNEFFQNKIENLIGRKVITATHGGDRRSNKYLKDKQQN